jgi:hypothetical protein
MVAPGTENKKNVPRVRDISVLYVFVILKPYLIVLNTLIKNLLSNLNILYLLK